MGEEKKGFFSRNLLPKILILIAVGLIVSVVIFGLPLTIPDLIFTIIRIIIGIGILVFAIKIMEKIILPQKSFSPTESWKSKLVRIAEMSKPPQVKELWMRGEDMHAMTKFSGTIVGLLFIPYWVGSPKIDVKSGKFVYVEKRDKLGNIIYDNNGKPVMVTIHENITQKDGEWLFVVSQGFIPALAKKVLVRANVQLCSDIGQKIYIKTVNLVPFGDFFVPHQSWQADIVKINMQHSSEVVEETLLHYLDVWSSGVESSIKLDPTYVKMMQANTENISQKESTPIQSLGQR